MLQPYVYCLNDSFWEGIKKGFIALHRALIQGRRIHREFLMQEDGNKDDFCFLFYKIFEMSAR